jgi:hypothetical protein
VMDTPQHTSSKEMDAAVAHCIRCALPLCILYSQSGAISTKKAMLCPKKAPITDPERIGFETMGAPELQ